MMPQGDASRILRERSAAKPEARIVQSIIEGREKLIGAHESINGAQAQECQSLRR